MAIRPVDLQSSYFQAVQNAATTARAEVAPQQAAQAAQAAFVNELEEREESVAETDHAEGGRIDVKGERERQQGSGRRRERRDDGTFEEVADEAAGLDGESHLIDFTA